MDVELPKLAGGKALFGEPIAAHATLQRLAENASLRSVGLQLDVGNQLHSSSMDDFTALRNTLPPRPEGRGFQRELR
jgi:hypothetical protein